MLNRFGILLEAVIVRMAGTGRTVAFAMALLCVFGSLCRPAAATEDYLTPEAAFRFSAVMKDARTVAVTYAIADGYYMYRERFQFEAVGATLGAPIFPAGKVKFDTTFQKNVETYRHAVTIDLPVQSAGRFDLSVTGQGCADLGLCYSPMTSKVSLSPRGQGFSEALRAALGGATPETANSSGSALSKPTPAPAERNARNNSSGIPPASATTPEPAARSLPASESTSALTSAATSPTAPISASEPAAATASGSANANATANGTSSTSGSIDTASSAPDDAGRISTALQSGRLAAIVPLFLLLGIGLSFTPCVLPMVPILSSIIVGQGTQISRRRALMLSVAYSLGMAIIYTALGIAAGLIGEGLAAVLQNAWVLGAFALLMVGLSLSMFGWYELQVPGRMQARLTQASQGMPGGRLAGVFFMGALSALIVGPCVAAPLAGALVYISQTRNVLTGGSALFAMAIGMSVPLLLVGVSAGTLLPRAGAWMDAVKRVFGVLMLGVALWMVGPVLPAATAMIGWAALGLGAGAWLLWSAPRGWLWQAAGLAVTTLGILQLVGLATGGRDVLQPLAHLQGSPQPVLRFTRIKSPAQLDAILAKTDGKTVLLDFYADWCVSCKEMEKLTFSDSGIRRQLAATILLQADVTANDADDRALLKRFTLFGPPGIILFDRHGKEIAGGRVIGYQDPKRFALSLAPIAATAAAAPLSQRAPSILSSPLTPAMTSPTSAWAASTATAAATAAVATSASTVPATRSITTMTTTATLTD